MSRAKFKVGDRVRRIEKDYPDDGMLVGSEYTVVGFNNYSGDIILEGIRNWWSTARFELVSPEEVAAAVEADRYRAFTEKLLNAYESSDPQLAVFNVVRRELVTKEYKVTVTVMADSPEQAQQYAVKGGHVESVEVVER